MRFYLSFAIVFCVQLIELPSYGQININTIQGKVIDIKTELPIPFATIRLSMYPIGTIADENGDFQLILQLADEDKFQIVCSSIGFYSKSIIISKKQYENQTIALIPSSVLLEEVLIYSNPEKKLSPKKILKNALKSLQESCPSHVAKTSFHHFITENGIYRKFFEAEIFINDPVGYGKSLNSGGTAIGDNVKFIQKRESLDLSMDKVRFDNHVNNPFEFLNKNGMKYAFWGKGYEFNIDTIDQENERTIILYATQKKDTIDKKYGVIQKYDMKFYMTPNVRDSKKLNIAKFELIKHLSVKNDAYKFEQNSVFVSTIRKMRNYMAPNIIENTIIQQTVWPKDPNRNSKIISYHHLKFDSIIFDDESKFIETESNLRYEPLFWDYKPIKKNVKDELSEYIPVEDQFYSQDNELKNNKFIDSINYIRWNNWINKSNKKNTAYMIVWDDQSVFFKDLVYEPLRDLAMVNANVKIVFIGTMLHYGLWEGTSYSVPGYAFFTHFYLPYSWEKVIHSECNHSKPHFLIIDKFGKISCSSSPFSTSYLRVLE